MVNASTQLCITKFHNMEKRKVKVAVISDVHLGTFGCHAGELNKYLKSISPEILIINGDFIDIWQLSKFYFPDSHWRVIKRIIKMMMNGTQVYYLTGNHDEMLRKFSGAQLDNFHLEDKLVLELDGKRFWFFHGDVFDVTMQHGKWLAKLGAVGYDTLIHINSFANARGYECGNQGPKLGGSATNSSSLNNSTLPRTWAQGAAACVSIKPMPSLNTDTNGVWVEIETSWIDSHTLEGQTESVRVYTLVSPL